jgi:predicted O-methyltransferase YrrM
MALPPEAREFVIAEGAKPVRQPRVPELTLVQQHVEVAGQSSFLRPQHMIDRYCSWTLTLARVTGRNGRYVGVTGLPPLVKRALSIARQEGFKNSCRPEHRRLLFALAAGAESIGETGTGCGVGLAWLASGARPGTRLVSVELDAQRAELAAELFSGLPHVTVIQGDWREIYRAGPFDLLVLDGCAHDKSGGKPVDPERLLRPGGTVVIDDLTPAQSWPPRFDGQVDAARMLWLTHPGPDATELRLAPDLAALVATRRFPSSPPPPQSQSL